MFVFTNAIQGPIQACDKVLTKTGTGKNRNHNSQAHIHKHEGKENCSSEPVTTRFNLSSKLVLTTPQHILKLAVKQKEVHACKLRQVSSLVSPTLQPTTRDVLFFVPPHPDQVKTRQSNQRLLAKDGASS